MDKAYEPVEKLDEPERPWRRVWRCPATGVFVKTYARRDPGPLGFIIWRITASACNAEGDALRRDDGSSAVLLGTDGKPFTHLVQVEPEADPRTLEPIAQRLERGLKFMVARVEFAQLNERDAGAV